MHCRWVRRRNILLAVGLALGCFFASLFLQFTYTVWICLFYNDGWAACMKYNVIDIFLDQRINPRQMLNTTKPGNFRLVSKVWQVQEDRLSLLLYSAFYDDRPDLSSAIIRVISVADTDLNMVNCLLWFEKRHFPDMVPGGKSDIGQPIYRYGRALKPNLFSCKIPSNASYRPDRVSIITHSKQKPTNLIKIHYPEKPPTDQIIEFGHCLSVLYWKHEPKRLVEWLELHKLWGVGEFNVYASSLDTTSRFILQNYPGGIRINFHELPDIFGDGEKDSIRLNMSPALTDCLYRNMYRYKYIVCTDTDELIVPLLDDNYTDLVKRIKKEQWVINPFPSFAFRNVYFFTDLGTIDNTSNSIHTQKYLKHLEPSRPGYSIKSFTSPQTCAGLQNHYCWKHLPKYNYYGLIIGVKTSIGMNFHYKMCHFDEYLHEPGHCAKIMKNYITNARMKHFNQVEATVHNTLKQLKLL